MDLNSLKVFTEVVNQGSFSGAAKSLYMPVSTVSRKVSELEESLGQKLLERSTRNLRLTESGETLFQYALRSVEEMEAGLMALEERQDQVEGTLRIAMPPNFQIGWEGLRHFMTEHPKVKLQTLAITREIDPISDHIDVVVQYQASNNPSVISRTVASMRPVLVASKEYVEEHGQPSTVEELKEFQCLARDNPDTESFWTLNGTRTYFQPYMTTNEFSFLRYLVKQGFGIAQLPPFFCHSEIESGEFILILPDVESPKVDVHMIYPSRKHLSRVVRAFIEHSVAYSQDEKPQYWQAG